MPNPDTDRQEPGVELCGVSHRYGRVVALDGIDLTVAAGSKIAIVGPDGVGKSTLLGLVAGAKRIQTGDVRSLGSDMGGQRSRAGVLPRIAYMPQGLGRNLYPSLSVSENVDFFARLFGHGAAERRRRIAELLKATGLDPFGDRLMGKLSGGMKQKLGLCCALVHDPDLLLLDEPTTGVDPLSRQQFWDLVESIRRARPRLTILTATSDIDEATRFERVAMLNDGRILADGTPAELLARTGASTLERAFVSLLNENGHGAVVDNGKVPATRPVESESIAIEAKGLTRRFGSFTAVDHVSFRIPRGEIFGFLGSNGCGKSTTMKMLTGLLPASEGEAFLFGEPVDASDIPARRRVGYMSQGFSLYGELTVLQNLRLHAAIFDYKGADASARVRELSETFGLSEYHDTVSERLPLGVRQRLQLAVALLHKPEVLILDEPTSGVDPIARDAFWDDLQRVSREDGVTIFISTHFMSEAERCDRIAFMHAGKVIASGAPEKLKEETQSATLDEAFIAYMKQGGREEVASFDAALPTATGATASVEQTFSLRRAVAYARREMMELVRDPIRLAFSLLGTAILMLILGYGITLDVDDLRLGVLDRDQTAESRAYIDSFAASTAFRYEGPLADHEELEQKLKANDIAIALEIPERFGADLRSGHTTTLLATLDGAMPFRAETMLGYVSGAHAHFLTEAAQAAGISASPAASVEMRYRYNQAFRSLDAMVPAVVAILLLFIPSILTALGVVSEKELGSISNLYVTPVTKLEFLLGKQAPYVIVGCVNYVVLVVMAVALFGVPIRGSFLGLSLAAFLYLLATTAIGILSSTMTRTQVAAMFATAIGTMMPATQFAGLLQPVATLEGVGRIIGTLFPTTYFLRASVGAFTKALGFSDLVPFILPLVLFWPVLIAMAWLLLRKQEV